MAGIMPGGCRLDASGCLVLAWSTSFHECAFTHFHCPTFLLFFSSGNSVPRLPGAGLQRRPATAALCLGYHHKHVFLTPVETLHFSRHSMPAVLRGRKHRTLVHFHEQILHCPVMSPAALCAVQARAAHVSRQPRGHKPEASGTWLAQGQVSILAGVHG